MRVCVCIQCVLVCMCECAHLHTCTYTMYTHTCILTVVFFPFSLSLPYSLSLSLSLPVSLLLALSLCTHPHEGTSIRTYSFSMSWVEFNVCEIEFDSIHRYILGNLCVNICGNTHVHVCICEFSCNLLSILLRCDTRPYEWRKQSELNSPMEFCLSSLLTLTRCFKSIKIFFLLFELTSSN